MSWRKALDEDRLYELLWDFARHRVVTAAVKCGMLATLAKRDANIEEVASELSLDPLATGKVMRALHAIGLLKKEGDKYKLVEQLRPLFDGGSRDITGFVEHSQRLYERWGSSLEEWLRTGVSPKRALDAEGLMAFHKGMLGSARLLAAKAARAIGIDDIRSMLDVGGGVGGWAVEFCRKAPRLCVTVVDFPEVVELGRKYVAEQGLSDRISFMEGDWLASKMGLEKYDLVLLANLIHTAAFEDAKQMVYRAAAQAGQKGRVAVVDFKIDDEKRDVLIGALFAINMFSRGDTYSEKEIKAWMTEAGLCNTIRRDITVSHWVIIGERP